MRHELSVQQLATVLGVITSIGVIGTGVANWWRRFGAPDERISSSLDRMARGLEDTRHLEAMGEPAWAAERRKDAWMDPLMLLARFEHHRAHPGRSRTYMALGVTLIAGVAFTVAAQYDERLAVPAVVCAFAYPIFVMWLLFSSGRWERAVKRRAEAKYEAHVDAGRVEALDRPGVAELGVVPSGQRKVDRGWSRKGRKRAS